MFDSNRQFYGIGLYTIPEGAHLTGVPTRSIRRWVLGYKYTRDDETHTKPPVWKSDHPSFDDTVGLSFLDLLEVRFIHAFRKLGVSWKVIRLAAERASEEFQRSHPFVSKRFRTDGHWILLESIEKTGEKRLLDLVRQQYEFDKIVSPNLKGGLDFTQDDEVTRWFPDWPRRQVVIDPQRSFGRPIIASKGIPTEILAKAVDVEGSEHEVAKWYDVPISAVKAAVRFEARLGA